MKNAIEVRGDITAIKIVRRDGIELETLVDTTDIPRLRKFGTKWCSEWYADIQNYRVYGYVLGTGRRRRRLIYLHRFLLNAPPHLQVDHINHDTLDNRRSNLRLVTASGNQQNRKGPNKINMTGVRGVHVHTSSGLYRVRFQRNFQTIHLGYFRELEDAAKVARAFLANEKVSA